METDYSIRPISIYQFVFDIKANKTRTNSQNCEVFIPRLELPDCIFDFIPKFLWLIKDDYVVALQVALGVTTQVALTKPANNPIFWQVYKF